MNRSVVCKCGVEFIAPCSRGRYCSDDCRHGAQLESCQRYHATEAGKEKRRQQQRARYRSNPALAARIKAAASASYWANPAIHKEREKLKRAMNGEAVRTRDRERYANNPEPKRLSALRYSIRHHEKFRSNLERQRIRSEAARRALALFGIVNVDGHVAVRVLRDLNLL